MPNYKKIAAEARGGVLGLIYKAQTSHIGSNFSAIDIMAVLFEKADPKKDEIILSAGWKAAAWYYFLWRKGIITEEELNSFCQPNSSFIGLVEPMNRWGLRCSGGSMGMGLPFGVGFALAKKVKSKNNTVWKRNQYNCCKNCKRSMGELGAGEGFDCGNFQCECHKEGNVYVLMSDGEMQCGTTWESALIAAHHKLDNLIVIVDYNQYQAMGPTNEILNLFDLREKWTSFKWNMFEIDGHNFDHLDSIPIYHSVGKKENSQPTVVIANTIKGRGVSFMENNNLWHYKAPSQEEYEKAMKELNGIEL